MGIINTITSGVDNLSNKAGSMVYEKSLKKVVAAEALKKSSPDIVAKAVQDAAPKAAQKADYAYRLAQGGLYGAGIGAGVGLVRNARNDNTTAGTIGGTGLGAIGGAGVGAVAAAIAKGIR